MLKKQTILIAEDSILNRTALCRILQEFYEVIVTEDGEQALEAIAENASVISAIILDIYMPKMDGFEVLAALQKNKELWNIPVLVCTSKDEDSVEVKALELGARDFARKPYRRDVLLSRLKNIIKQSELENQYTPYYDPLTGIYSASTFYEKTQKQLKSNEGTQYVIVRWNLERFKLVNDIFGRDKGDEILKGIAGKLKSDLSSGPNTFARLEADHFIFCVPYDDLDITDMLTNVDKFLASFINEYKVISNFGVYVIDDIDMPIELMCDRANLALNSCKGNYAFPCAVYDAKMRDKMLIRQDIVVDMVKAIEEKQFEVYYQPVVDVATTQITGAEALIRWNHPRRGMISPGEFIPIFEENGFITQIDDYVGTQVCNQLALWREQGKRQVPISMNLSRISFYNPSLVDKILKQIKEKNIDPSLMEFEITEGTYIEDPKSLLETMERLQEAGFKFLMDDFGSGYSSFNMLKDVPFDILKIDLKFLEGMDRSNRSGTIVSSIIKMAKWLNMPVIAEGVETKFQMEFLRSVGCDKMQGYFFSKPVTLEKFEKLLENNFSVPNIQVMVDKTMADFDSIFSVNEIVTKMLNSLGGGIGIYEMRNDEIEVLKVNDEYYSILGYNPSTLFSDKTPIFERQPKLEDQKLLRNACIYVAQSKRTQYIQIRRNNAAGEMIWLKLTIQYLGHSGKNALLCIAFVDISDIVEQQNIQSKISEELQRQREIYSIVAGQSGTIAFEWEIIQDIWTNDSGFESFVLSRQSPTQVFSGNILPETAPYEDIPKLIELFTDRTQTFNTTQKDVRLAKTTGNLVWCRVSLTYICGPNGERLRAIGTINVIEEKVRERQKARHQQEAYRLINRSNNDVIIDYDIDTDILQYTVKMPNGTFADYKMPGYRDYILKSTAIEDEFKQEYLLALLAASTQIDTQTLEYRADIRGDGFRWVRSELTGLQDENGKTYRVVGWVNDIQSEKDITAKLNKEQGYVSAMVAESLFAFEYDFATAQATLVHQTQKYEQEFLPYKNYIGSHSQTTSIHPEDMPSVRELLSNDALQTAFDGGEHIVRTRYRIKDKIGRWVWVECVTYILKKPDTGTLQSLVYFKIVDSEKKAHDELVKKAQLDEVSGIFNRATTESKVDECLAESEGKSGFLMVDIDNFKTVNDTMGHMAGDKLIGEIGRALRAIFRSDDIVGRIGGDEFCVLLKNVGEIDTVLEKANQISNAVKNISKEINGELQVSASVGLYLASPKSRFRDICSKADKAMYSAKKSGKDKVVIYKDKGEL